MYKHFSFSNMKRTLFIVFSIVSIFLTAACQKEKGLVTLGAKIVDNNTKVYIENRTPKWNDGDPVWVNGDGNLTISDADGTNAKIRNVSSQAPYVAIYPAEFASGESTNPTVTIPSVQVYETDGNNQKVMTPMAAVSNDNSLFFYNLCSLVKVTIVNNTGASMSLKKITVKANSSNLSGSAALSISTTNETVNAGSISNNGSKTATLTFSNCTVANLTSQDFYIAVAPFSSENNITITVYTTNNKKFSRTRNISSLDGNTIASAHLNVNSLQDYGYFTVDGIGTKVLFSPGNLQYKSDNRYDNGTFRFAEHQYDYVGNSTAGNGNVYVGDDKCCNLIYSSRITGTNDYYYFSAGYWIDLFGWGTSGFNGINGCYASTFNSSYGPNGPINETYYDWGVNNSSSLGTGWRTLTKDEWGHLFNSRTFPVFNINGTETEARYLQLIINGVMVGNQEINVRGIAIFPDDFEWPDGISLPTTLNTLFPFRSNNGTTSVQQYTLQQWETLEDAGVIFLPSCGYRERNGSGSINNIIQNIDNLYYWSSTSHNVDNAYCLCIVFNASPYNTLNTSYSQYRRMGCSVRLVKNVQ